jgi:murein DD-endopeptidase MepM/ murein hydrolase activator NlpD
MERLNKRVVEIYTSDPTEPLSVVLEAASFGDLLDQLEFLSDIGRQDERLASEVKQAKLDMRDLRQATRRTRNAQVQTTREVEVRTEEQRAVRDRLAWNQRELATARRDKQATLADVREDKSEALEHMDELEAESAALSARIQAAQTTSQSRSTSRSTSYSMPARTPSASGFIWPVHGVVTSIFGWRWGRMHEGIDIAVASGTPVVSAAGGMVIVAGWMGGYGNLVVVDHGNGIATAYGHNTNVAVSVGQAVAQGQLIAYSGNTGNSTGPHVHFEVRVGGAAVDPFGYL